MANITYRVNSNPSLPGASTVKGVALTNVEVDANFKALDAELATFKAAITPSGPNITVAGDVTIADKIVHAGDTNTSIRFPIADTITAETSGVERMRIDSAGNVGIGTSSPDAKLHVNGDAIIGNRSSTMAAPGDLFAFPNPENTTSFMAASYEITEVTCVADVAGNLAGKYFRVYGPAGTAASVDTTAAEQIVDFWFQVSGSGTQPASGAGRYVQVNVATNDSAINVAAAIAQALAGDAGFSAGVDGAGGVFIVAKTPGNFTDSSAATSGFTVVKTEDGSGSLAGTNKWVGGVLAPNGKIYGIPYNSTSVLTINAGSSAFPNWYLSAYTNKF
jgi:hypothetical protein